MSQSTKTVKNFTLKVSQYMVVPYGTKFWWGKLLWIGVREILMSKNLTNYIEGVAGGKNWMVKFDILLKICQIHQYFPPTKFYTVRYINKTKLLYTVALCYGCIYVTIYTYMSPH